MLRCRSAQADLYGILPDLLPGPGRAWVLHSVLQQKHARLKRWFLLLILVQVNKVLPASAVTQNTFCVFFVRFLHLFAPIILRLCWEINSTLEALKNPKFWARFSPETNLFAKFLSFSAFAQQLPHQGISLFPKMTKMSLPPLFDPPAPLPHMLFCVIYFFIINCAFFPLFFWGYILPNHPRPS